MSEFNIWVILLLNQSEEFGEKQLSVFGQISPLMHVGVVFQMFIHVVAKIYRFFLL